MGNEYGREAVAALDALRELLGSSSRMKVIHPGGHLWDAYFSFNEGVHPDAVEAIERALGLPLPRSFKDFLDHYDGCMLYEDREYGQWGIQVYGTGDLVSENARLREENGEYWPVNYLVVARMLGESDVLAIDLSRPTKQGDDYVVLDGDADLLPKDWLVAARDFGTFIDHLVVAQGARYWRWK